jgi:hypothetical protein
VARVYVSSTFADLEDHREAVRQAIRRMGHTDVAMEYYVAEDRRPLDKCLADVRDCDLYLIVMAWRYGYIPRGHNQSITHLEYQAAVAGGKPCFVFILDDSAPWPPNRMERAALDRVDAFRADLMRDHLAALFTTKDDLARHVTEALQHWERKQTAQPATTTDWDAYRQAVRDRYRWVILSVIAGAQHDRLHHIPLHDVFVPPRTQAGRPHFDVPDRGSSVPEDSTAVLGREFRQVFLGGPGSGKSTMFRAKILWLCNNPEDYFFAPFLVELREYALRGFTDFMTYLRETAWDKFGVQLTEEALTERLSKGNATVFFDGLDEIFEPAARARVVDQFQSFANRFPHIRVVVSSRIVGYDENGLGLAGFTHYTLLDFGLVEVGTFIPRWYEHYTLENDERDAAGLVRRISENPRLLELAGNPLLLTMMAIIYKNQDLPEKRWQLYARCADVLLEDWDVKRKNINRDELLPFPMAADQKAEILQNVATSMLSHSDRQELNAVRYELLRNIVADYLHEQYARSPGEARAIAIDILNHLRERTYLLAETGDQIFGFVHRTFMEYFAARHILAEFNRNKADYGWLKNEVFLKHWKTDRWREPLLLLSGMLAGQGSPIREVVTALIDHSLPFAARCLGEAGTVPPEDRSWASDLVHTLATRLRRTLGMGEERNEYVEESVAAFGLLIAFVEIIDETRILITEMVESKSPKIRIIGWRLRFAFGAKEVRRQYAVDSLIDDDQAVRRAAVASLEREWPGDDGVFQVLIAQLLDEKDVQVREVMISAMDSGWPRRTETLDAIEQRLATETEWLHAIWVIDHLASAWRGDARARNIVLGAAALPHPIGAAMLDVPEALLRGWSEAADTRRFLRHAAATAANPQVRLTAIRTYIDLDPSEALDWLWGFIDEDEAPPLDKIFLELARVQSRPEVLDWFIAVVARHPSVRHRAAVALESTARSMTDTEITLRAYAHAHPDENTRAVALSVVQKIVPAGSLGIISASFRGLSIPDHVILAARQILSSNQLGREDRTALETALANVERRLAP